MLGCWAWGWVWDWTWNDCGWSQGIAVYLDVGVMLSQHCGLAWVVFLAAGDLRVHSAIVASELLDRTSCGVD